MIITRLFKSYKKSLKINESYRIFNQCFFKTFVSVNKLKKVFNENIFTEEKKSNNFREDNKKYFLSKNGFEFEESNSKLMLLTASKESYNISVLFQSR